MSGYFGFPGEVSYLHQNRIRAPYKGCADVTGVSLQLDGLGRVQPLPSGTYRGAPGLRTRKTMYRNRDRDVSAFAQIGIPLTGPIGLSSTGLGVTDREACQALSTTGGGIYAAVAAAVGASQPNATQQQRDNAARLTAQLTAGGAGISALSNLCNLINQQPAVNGGDPNLLIQQALQQAQQQAQASALWAAQQQQSAALSLSSMSTGTKLALGAAAVGVIGLGAWFLLK
jgi:hypothetical protein